jgi:putative aminopeptidase FrvX
MKTSPELLRRTVKSYEKDIVRFSRDLIAIPGFSGTEGPVCKRIAKEMKKVGFDKVGDRFQNVTLTGPADFVFEGTIEL